MQNEILNPSQAASQLSAPATRVRSNTLERLNEQAVTQAFKLSDVDWSLAINHEQNWMPHGLVNIRFLPTYLRLSAEHRLRYNQIYAMAIAEQFIWFEEGIVIPIMRNFLKSATVADELRECLEHFIADELKHSEMFRALLKKVDPARYAGAGAGYEGYQFYNLSRGQRYFYKLITENPNLFITWIWMTIYFEERTMHISRLYRDESVERTFARCHQLHMVDEARHLQIDQYLLKHLYDGQPRWKRFLAGKMHEQVLAAYAAPKRISRKVLAIMGEEFSADRSVFAALESEFGLLPKNREFISTMFGDSAIGRTRELLARYPEMKRALAVIS